ncbi:MAG TPA: zinc ribbon domain-containing protein [Candidatus Saccharimonadia bacterium]|nr:zinc ribbon domain-containing protein [Candidatus Saccharimonadia bacterium]
MTEEDAARTQMTCPRCGSARSKSATFCGVCGQDLRPGASVVPPAPPTEPAATSDAKPPKSGRGLLRRKPIEAGGTAAAMGAAATQTPAETAAAPGQSASGPIMLPGTQTALPKEKPVPKEPAVVPKTDTTMSFSERYRGTQYSNPDVERFLPPVHGANSGRRWGRIVGLMLFVAALGAALVASWFLLFSPQALIGPTTSPTIGAAASGTPGPTPTPKPTIHGAIPDEVEIAACLLLSEDTQRRPDIDALRTDALAGGAPDLAARAAAVSATIEASRPSLPTLSSAPQTEALAAAWLAVFDVESDALGQMAAAPLDAKALKAAVKRLDETKAGYKTLDAAQAAFVATYPEATCTVAP